ncbi:hypothetical protein D3C81_1292080 [compost metagenome]
MEANNEEPESDLAKLLVEYTTEHFRPPIVKAREQSENQSTDDNIVEVSYYEIRIVELVIRWCGCKHDPCNPTHNEGRNEAGCVEVSCRETDLSSP